MLVRVGECTCLGVVRVTSYMHSPDVPRWPCNGRGSEFDAVRVRGATGLDARVVAQPLRRRWDRMFARLIAIASETTKLSQNVSA